MTDTQSLLFRISKILIIESNSQPGNPVPFRAPVLFRISKILIIESNSQRLFGWGVLAGGCSEYQRY